MALSVFELIRLLNRHADAADHKVFVDDVETGTCIRASFRVVFSLRGVEVVLDYTYEENGTKTTFSSRPRPNQLKSGQGERILVNGQDVDNDDVIVGSDSSAGPGSLYVEFKYRQSGTDHRVKFAAPATAFQ
ncbi:hypothetical protein EON82_11780 [bacterium]|nr:MAG: hypothetical protein EON82_11780 [bacterium]